MECRKFKYKLITKPFIGNAPARLRLLTQNQNKEQKKNNVNQKKKILRIY